MKRKASEFKPGIAIRKHALQHGAVLLRRFAYEVNRTARLGNADAIHDLRVSIRRLIQCLRVFQQFFPRGKAKKVRRSLKELMVQAAEVRNRDVALVLLHKAGIPAGSAAVEKLTQERERDHRALLAQLEGWSRHGSFKKWRAQLEL